MLGSAVDPSFLTSFPTFDVVVSTTEDIGNYLAHSSDTLALPKLTSSHTAAENNKLLVLFTSGRTKYSLTLFDYRDSFHAIVLRPTTLYGYSGSYYVPFFILAQQAKDSGSKMLTLSGFLNSLLHGTNVDDVAAAYPSLASAPRSSSIVNQVFNIPSYRYETLKEIDDAIEKSYRIKV